MYSSVIFVGPFLLGFVSRLSWLTLLTLTAFGNDNAGWTVSQ